MEGIAVGLSNATNLALFGATGNEYRTVAGRKATAPFAGDL